MTLSALSPAVTILAPFSSRKKIAFRKNRIIQYALNWIQYDTIKLQRGSLHHEVVYKRVLD